MKYKILMVENKSHWQKILRHKIRSALIHVNLQDDDIKVIDTFDEAYIALEQGSWNLFIADIGLGKSPQEEAQKLGKELVHIGYIKNIPTIVVSGYLDPQEVFDLIEDYKILGFFWKESFNGRNFITKVQQILPQTDTPSQAKIHSSRPTLILQSDIRKLVYVLASLAATSPAGPQRFFRELVNKANLPQDWVLDLAGIWTGNANYDALELVNWALARNGNPNDRRFTTLGSILEVLLTKVGFNDAKLIISLIIIYQLYTDKKLLEKLQITYQVPIPTTNITPTTSNFGPNINWQEPDKTELESWFKPEPDFLDVGFLMQAIQHATSVCRIEIPNQGILGTGFLIAPNLVLTNYHVLYPETTDTQINPKDIILRFGCFTSATGNETEGQAFKLVDDKPILQSSPTNKLDYALLQVEDSITQAKDIAEADCDFENLPQQKMALNILQHPEGASMKIAISSNAIANIFPDSGLIQYVTRTSPGSSGSPCFDKDWKVVALHHAQRVTHFGSIREGILLSSIYKEIQQHLE